MLSVRREMEILNGVSNEFSNLVKESRDEDIGGEKFFSELCALQQKV